MNRLIQQIVTKFNVECRSISDELGKSMEKLVVYEGDDEDEENREEIFRLGEHQGSKVKLKYCHSIVDRSSSAGQSRLERFESSIQSASNRVGLIDPQL